MNSYLDRLKVIESGKILSHTPVTEVPKAPFDTFDTSAQAQIEKNSADILETQRERRRQKVLKMLADNPSIQRAFVTDTEADPDNVIIAFAIRDVGTCELLIPHCKYDPFAVLEVIGKAGTQ